MKLWPLIVFIVLIFVIYNNVYGDEYTVPSLNYELLATQETNKLIRQRNARAAEEAYKEDMREHDRAMRDAQEEPAGRP